METYKIGESSVETIEFKVSEDSYALVHKNKHYMGGIYKTIIMNQREIFELYQALQEEILKLGVLK